MERFVVERHLPVMYLCSSSKKMKSLLPINKGLGLDFGLFTAPVAAVMKQQYKSLIYIYIYIYIYILKNTIYLLFIKLKKKQ